MVALAILASFAAAGCGGSKGSKAPPRQSAPAFADGFVQRLVAGNWDAVAEDVAPLETRVLRDFQQSIRRDGIRKSRGPGVLRHDCPANPTVGVGKDCFVYRFAGRQVVPAGGVVNLNSRFRLWTQYVDGRWQVISYDYDLLPPG